MSRQSKRTDRTDQPEIDWVRYKRRNWLEQVDIPPFQRVEAGGVVRMVRTARMKHFLMVLERFDRSGDGYALYEETLASRMSVDKRTVRRVIGDLEQRGLLIVDRNDGKASLYRIVWSEVAQILLDNPKTSHLVERPITPPPPKLTPDNLTATPDKLVLTPDNLADTPDNLSASSDDRTSISRARGFKPCLQPCSQPSIEPCDGISFQGFHGWPFEIKREHLRSRETVQRLWEHAQDNRYVQEDCRVKFFALAICVAGKPEVKNPGGYFTARVIQKKWLGSRSDIRRAIDAIAMIDGRGVEVSTSSITDRLRTWESERNRHG